MTPTIIISQKAAGYWCWEIYNPNVPEMPSYAPGMPERIFGFSESREDAALHAEACIRILELTA